MSGREAQRGRRSPRPRAVHALSAGRVVTWLTLFRRHDGVRVVPRYIVGGPIADRSQRRCAVVVYRCGYGTPSRNGADR